MNFFRKRIIISFLFYLLFSGFIFTFIFSAEKSFAQTKQETIDFRVHCTKGKNSLQGVQITVLKSSYFQVDERITGIDGRATFELPFGYDYKIIFKAPGCVDMFMMVLGKTIPRELTDIYPTYKAEVPFFETSDVSVNAEKYKSNPFTKVIYDGRKSMEDDKPYLDKFTSNMLLNEDEQAKILAAKLKKEKDEKDRLLKEKLEREKADLLRELAKKQEQERQDAEQKRKHDMDALARRQAEEKAMALQKAREDSMDRYNEMARLKEEADRKQKQSMETEAQRLKREAEEKALAEKKNKDIKTNMENELLKLAAENERNAKQKALAIQLEEARANSIIEQMRQEAKLKSDQLKLALEQKDREFQLLKNQQDKNSEMKKIVVAAAYSDKEIKATKQKEIPDVKKYVRKVTPTVTVTEDNGFFKDVRTTVITYYQQYDTYRKERTLWGTVHWYKNNKEIEEVVYNVEINFYLAYASK